LVGALRWRWATRGKIGDARAHQQSSEGRFFARRAWRTGQAIVEILSSTADRLLRNDDEGIDRDTANAQAELKNVVRQAAAKQPTPIVAVAASSIID